MNSIDLIERLARTDPFPAGSPLPESNLTMVSALASTERTLSMQTQTPETRTPSVTRRRRLIAAMSLGVVAVIATVAVLVVGGDQEVATASNPLDSQIQTAALGGEPLAVVEAWWWAYWSGDVELLTQLTDPEIFSIATLDELIGESEFQASLHAGDHWWTVSDCGLVLGFDDRFYCDITSTPRHLAYGWDDGFSPQSFTVVVSDDGRVTSFNHGAVFSGLTPNAVFGPARAADESGFAAVCEPILDDRTTLGAFYNYLSSLGAPCGEFLRAYLLE